MVAGVVYWQTQRQAAARRHAAWEERQADHRLLERLEQAVDSYGGELTLVDFADFLAQQSGLEVEIDRPALAAEGVRPEIDTVVLPRGRLALRSIVRLALGELQLAYDLRGGRLQITTPEAVETLSAMYLEVYPLPQPNLTPRDATAEDWSLLITTSIEPYNWDWVGGRGHLEAVPGGLVVLQTREAHEHIRALLARLGPLDNPPASWEPIYFPASEPGPAHQKIEATLDKPFAFTFDTAGAAHAFLSDVTDVQQQLNADPRGGVSLAQNSPNPFNPSTSIRYELPAPSSVSLKVYNAHGQVVAVVVDGRTQSGGSHTAQWNGRTTNGSQAASGMYFFRLEARPQGDAAGAPSVSMRQGVLLR
jgi:hypothetical protein